MTDDVLISGNEREPFLPPLPRRGVPTGRDQRTALAVLVAALLVLGVLKALPGVEFPFSLLALALITGMQYGGTAAAVGYVHARSGVLALSFFGIAELGAYTVQRYASSDPDARYYPVLLGVVIGCAALSVLVGWVAQRLDPWLATGVSLAVGLGAVYLQDWLLLDQGPERVRAVSAPGLPEFRIGALLISSAYSGMFLVGVLVLGALLVLMRREVPFWTPWALLGGASAAFEAFALPTHGIGRTTYYLFAVVVVAAGIAGLRPLTAFVVGLAVAALEQVWLWNVVHHFRDYTYVLGGIGVIAAVVWGLTGPKREPRSLVPGRFRDSGATAGVTAVLALAVLVVPARDRDTVGVAAAVAVLSLAFVLLRYEASLDLSGPVIAGLAAQLSFQLSDDLVVLLLVVAPLSAVGTLLAHALAGRRPFALPLLGVSLTLIATTPEDWAESRAVGLKAFGQSLNGEYTHGLLSVLVLPLAALLVGWARGRDPLVRRASAGAVYGLGAVAYTTASRHEPAPLLGLGLAITVVVIAALAAARTTALVALSSALLAGAATVLVLENQIHPWVLGLVGGAVIAVALAVTPLLAPKGDSIG